VRVVMRCMWVADHELEHAHRIEARDDQKNNRENDKRHRYGISFHGRNVSKARLITPAAAQYQP
jgi:hypothetical protein